MVTDGYLKLAFRLPYRQRRWLFWLVLDKVRYARWQTCRSKRLSRKLNEFMISSFGFKSDAICACIFAENPVLTWSETQVECP